MLFLASVDRSTGSFFNTSYVTFGLREVEEHEQVQKPSSCFSLELPEEISEPSSELSSRQVSVETLLLKHELVQRDERPFPDRDG